MTTALSLHSLALALALSHAPGDHAPAEPSPGLHPPAAEAPAPGMWASAAPVAPPHVVDIFGHGFDAFGVVARLPDDAFATFDGQVVRRHTSSGLGAGVLAVLPAPAFAAFLRVIPGGEALLAGESTSGRLWRVALDGSGAQLVADLVLPYDATFLDAGHAVVNEAPCFPCSTRLLRVTLAGGPVTTLVQLTGPSGPLVHDGAGGVFVGDFPQPLGGPARVLHFGAALLEGPLPLDESDGTLVSDGYAGISSLAYDPLLARLYVAESAGPTGVGAVKVAGGSSATDEALLTGVPSRWLSDLQFLSGGPGVFHPFQPSSGGSLEVSSTDFAEGEAARLVLRPRRAELRLEGPGTGGAGAVHLSLEHAPPSGLALLVVGPVAAAGPETAIHLAGSLPWISALPLAQLVVLPHPIAIDGAGSAELDFTNPFGAPAVLWMQAACIAADGGVLGLSASAVL